MPDPKVTQSFAATFVDELARCGLEAVCVAPGSRWAPRAMAFARHPAIRVWMHLDERSASFFALGMAKATERPVALLCTSGTAAAEFHAAVIEAHHSRAPLLVLTADRPPELRDVGANQAIDQARLYGGAVRWCFDPGVPDAEPGAPARWRRLAARAPAEAAGPPAGPGPLHPPLPAPRRGPAPTGPTWCCAWARRPRPSRSTSWSPARTGRSSLWMRTAGATPSRPRPSSSAAIRRRCWRRSPRSCPPAAGRGRRSG